MEDFFKELILDELLKASLRRLFLKIPILGWGPFGIIITYFASKYATLLFEEINLLIDFKRVVITNESFGKAYNKAMFKLKVYSTNYGVESNEYKRIKSEAKESLADLVQFTIVT